MTVKKIIAAVLCAVLLLPVLSVGTYAETFEEDFGQVLSRGLFDIDFFSKKYDENYIYEIVCEALYTWEKGEKVNFQPIVFSEKEFEDMIHAYFVCGNDMIEKVRKLPDAAYDAKNKTYKAIYFGGMGGMLAPRQYAGFIDNGNGTYDVYFEHVTYEFLPAEIENQLTQSVEWPATYEYDGKIFEPGPEGYYRIASCDKYGRKYTVDYKDCKVRLAAVNEFAEKDYPSKFSVRKYTYNIPSSVSILSANAFENGTKLTITELKKGTKYKNAEEAISGVSGKYAIYDFSAVKGGKNVQPNGDFVFEIEVPSGFSNDLSVYYVSDDGKLEKLDSEFSSRMVWSEKKQKQVAVSYLTVTVKHFSTYAITDNSAEPKVTSSVTTEPTATTEPEATAEITDTAADGTTDPAATTAGETGKADDSEITADAQTTEADTELIMPGKDKNTAGIVIAVVAAVAVIAAAVAFVIVKKKKK